MKSCMVQFGLIAILLTSMMNFSKAQEPKEEAIKKDRQRIEGTWRIVELVTNGSESDEEDVKKLRVVNQADGAWSLRKDGEEISRGTSTIDPTMTPKTIDFTVTEGEGKGQRYQGIYQLGEDSRKLCFSTNERPRPTLFTAESGSHHILVKFERLESE